MRQARVLATLVLAFSVTGWSAGLRAAPQETKTARGTVTAMSGNSVIVKVRNTDMTFTADEKTEVIAPGAGTKERQAQAKGMPGPKLADVVKTGQAVIVSYHDMGGTLHAVRIEGVASAGKAGGSMSDDPPESKTMSGTVKSVAADSVTVTRAGKDMTFTIDSKTRVIGTGLGTKSAPQGGKLSIMEAVAAGDKVSVHYHDTGGTMHASSVRVTSKASK